MPQNIAPESCVVAFKEEGVWAKRFLFYLLWAALALGVGFSIFAIVNGLILYLIWIIVPYGFMVKWMISDRFNDYGWKCSVCNSKTMREKICSTCGAEVGKPYKPKQ